MKNSKGLLCAGGGQTGSRADTLLRVSSRTSSLIVTELDNDDIVRLHGVDYSIDYISIKHIVPAKMHYSCYLQRPWSVKLRELNPGIA